MHDVSSGVRFHRGRLHDGVSLFHDVKYVTLLTLSLWTYLYSAPQQILFHKTGFVFFPGGVVRWPRRSFAALLSPFSFTPLLFFYQLVLCHPLVVLHFFHLSRSESLSPLWLAIAVIFYSFIFWLVSPPFLSTPLFHHMSLSLFFSYIFSISIYIYTYIYIYIWYI